jgi:hypothetical protein
MLVKKSVVPVFVGGLMKTIGLFPYGMAKKFAKKSPFPTGLSNFPGGMETIYLDFENKRHPCIDAYCAAGIPSGRLGPLHFANLQNICKSN